MRLPFLRALARPATGFPVDDVEPSAERLPTDGVLHVMRDKLERGVLLGPLADRAALAGSHRYSSNPLVTAVHLAFSRHLPLALSPDAVWLTVLQGFSHHVAENAEALRGRLVRHQGSIALVEEIRELTIEQVAAGVAGFSRQIRDATDPAIHDALVCDFSTTTPDVRTASEIALMDTYSHYFTYEFAMCICGIPRVELAGTVDDWRRMRDSVELLDTFGLDWWTTRLRPMLDEFVRAADGRPDRDFWRGIYKYRPPENGPYDSGRVTGWIVDLFPYLGDAPYRVRNEALDPEGDRQVGTNAFPSGLSSVPIVLKLTDDNKDVIATHDLDLVGGLLGVEQANDTGALSPMISWCVARRASPPRQC